MRICTTQRWGLNSDSPNRYSDDLDSTDSMPVPRQRVSQEKRLR